MNPNPAAPAPAPSSPLPRLRPASPPSSSRLPVFVPLPLLIPLLLLLPHLLPLLLPPSPLVSVSNDRYHDRFLPNIANDDLRMISS